MIVEGVTSRNFFFSTRPSSPPANLKCHINTEFSLTFTWEEPVRKPDILEFFYVYELETDDPNYICKWYIAFGARSSLLNWDTESVLALNKKLKFPI